MAGFAVGQIQWVNDITFKASFVYVSAPQGWLHPRADPHHGHRMMTSSNLTSNGKQRALSHNRRKTSWTLWWLGHLSAAIQVIGEIPSANWLRPMICSTNHGGMQGGINPIVLDQSGPTPLAACGENATPSRRLADTQWESSRRESWTTS